jgi:hypothetical protein
MKKTVMSLAVALVGLFGTTSANAIVYFQSDFNGLADSTKVINGGLLSLTAYGEPNNWGIVRDSALTIYGGAEYNGAVSARLTGLGAEVAAGRTLLRMTGEYKTKSAWDNTPFATTAEIQYQNNSWYFNYNSLVINTVTPNWTAFTLDLNLAGLATDVAHIDMINLNFFIGGNAPGELQIDNLTVETVVPEPTSASLLGLGLAGLLASRSRRRS